jgi:hypothetical protein
VTLAFVPRGTDVEELAEAGFSPGLMSAGLGSVPAAQTYLDISQGNRVFDSLYDSDLPPEVGGGVCGPPYSPAVVERAETAPADIVPGLLAATLAGAGQGCEVAEAAPDQLVRLVDGLRGDDLLIAIERPPPGENEELAIGIAGRGFDGNLTSDSTRLDGYVVSTDVASTILTRLGIPEPDEMTGQPIRTEGAIDPASVESLGARMAVISERRGPVIGIALLVWLLALGIATLLSRGRVARGAGRLVALSIVYLPLVLLLAAALEPSRAIEQLLTIVLTPLLALLTIGLLGGFRALAVASAVTVLACAVDVVAGSPLTSLSLLGPNPGLGVRFYGVGNELEALLAVLVVAGTGAWIAGFLPRLAPERAAVAFLVAGLLFGFVFGFGRFGADVGAAIVLPFGAAVAAAAIAARRGRPALLVLAVPVLALALLAFLDLVSGANAHLTRSVLDAGGLDQVADVAQRRLELSARSFTRPVVYLFMPLVLVAGVLAVIGRDRIAAWLRGVPSMRAGMIGALAAVGIGALANDSGALVIEIGAAYLVSFLSFAWAEK